jgi:hypothetical protein
VRSNVAGAPTLMYFFLGSASPAGGAVNLQFAIRSKILRVASFEVMRPWSKSATASTALVNSSANPSWLL